VRVRPVFDIERAKYKESLVAEAALIGERSNRPDGLAADEPPRIAKRIDKTF
jgi:hypothetical protein